jgi:hypothetical protein
MQYMCLIYAPADGPDLTPEQWATLHKDYGTFTEEARASGKMVDGAPLEGPETATTIRVRDGKRLVTDGPFAETKEWLGGFYTFECATLDEALDWAARIPGAKYGSIEVRPIMVIPAAAM